MDNKPADPLFLCSICHFSASLEADRYVDEDGNPVHEACYLRKTVPTEKDAASIALAWLMRKDFSLVCYRA
jgi:hypothetical protein